MGCFAVGQATKSVSLRTSSGAVALRIAAFVAMGPGLNRLARAIATIEMLYAGPPRRAGAFR